MRLLFVSQYCAFRAPTAAAFGNEIDGVEADAAGLEVDSSLALINFKGVHYDAVVVFDCEVSFTSITFDTLENWSVPELDGTDKQKQFVEGIIESEVQALVKQARS